MSRHVYLKENEHLHSAGQVKRICNNIIRDYRTGKITYKTAMDRLVLMENFVVPRTDALEQKSISEAYIEKTKLELMRMRGRK
jgi:hypothetical protein